jgi:hypothetical protein
MKFLYAFILAFAPTIAFANNGLLSRIVNGTCNEVCTSFVDEVRIEKRMVRVCDGCCLKFECKDFAVTYRKKIWIEKVPVVHNVPKTITVNECVCMSQCVNGCNVMIPTTIQKQVVVNQPTVVGYTDKVIRCGIPHKICEQPVANAATIAPPIAQ